MSRNECVSQLSELVAVKGKIVNIRVKQCRKYTVVEIKP